MLEIRAVTAGDRPSWEILFRGYVNFYQAPDIPETFDAVWSWIGEGRDDLHSVIAWNGDQPLGLAQYQLMFRPSRGVRTCYLSDLFTVPEARGQGVGRALIDYTRNWALEQGAGDLRWLTAEDNATARKLYDSYAPRSPFILYSIPPKAD